MLIGKPGGNTVFEAMNSGLPLLVHNPLPGSQRRTCTLIEQWQVGRRIKQTEEMPGAIETLWSHSQELQRLRANTLALGHPGAVRVAAQGVLALLPSPRDKS